MRKRGRLIVLEGIDGSGKSAVAKTLKKELSKMGLSVVLYESVEKKYSEFWKLKPFVKNTPVNSSYLFYLSSAVHKSGVIREILKTHWVICDRYLYSTVAYHRVKRSKLRIELDSLGVLKPDYAFLLRVDEEIRKLRIKGKRNITSADKVPKVPGYAPYRIEKLFREMNLIEVDNSGLLQDTVAKIMTVLFPTGYD